MGAGGGGAYMLNFIFDSMTWYIGRVPQAVISQNVLMYFNLLFIMPVYHLFFV